MGSPCGYYPLHVLCLQQWTILLHLHSRWHCPDIWIRPHCHQDSEESISVRPLQIDLYLLHDSLCSQEHSIPVLQGTVDMMQGYLPNDQTGNFIFKIQELLATALSGYVLYTVMVIFKSSYNRDLDTVKCYYLIGIAAILALLFHSSLNRSFIGDYTWAFTQYLETFAIFSQFVLFRNKVILLLFFRKVISNHIHHTLWQHRPSRGSSSSYSGYSPMPNSTPTEP